MEKQIQAPLLEEEIRDLRAGDYVYITGTLYTARDAAHKRMQEALDRGEDLPFDIRAFSGQRGPAHRLRRTYHCQPHG